MVVMLCNLIEKKTIKCHKYWSREEKIKNFKLEKLSEKTLNDKLIVRDFSLTHLKTNEIRNVRQMHFTGWPDHGVPDLDQVFDTFQFMIQEVEKVSSPVVVHCSAGVGRTGTFITMYNLHYNLKKSKESDESSINFNIWNLVRKLKEFRIMSVENILQYKFVYSYMSKLLLKLLPK